MCSPSFVCLIRILKMTEEKSDEKVDEKVETKEVVELSNDEEAIVTTENKVTVISRNGARKQDYSVLLSDKAPEGKLTQTPTIYLTGNATAKLEAYLGWSIANSCEFSAFLEVETNTQGIWVSDLILPKQEGSAGKSEMDEDEVGDLFAERYANNQPPIAGWVHSHPGMSTFWSSTDDATIKRFMKHNLFVSLVLSDHTTCLSKLTMAMGLVIDKLPVFMDVSWDPAVYDAAMLEIAEKVDKKTFHSYKSTYNKGAHWANYGQGKWSYGHGGVYDDYDCGEPWGSQFSKTEKDSKKKDGEKKGNGKCTVISTSSANDDLDLIGIDDDVTIMTGHHERKLDDEDTAVELFVPSKATYEYYCARCNAHYLQCTCYKPAKEN